MTPQNEASLVMMKALLNLLLNSVYMYFRNFVLKIIRENGIIFLEFVVSLSSFGIKVLPVSQNEFDSLSSLLFYGLV